MPHPIITFQKYLLAPSPPCWLERTAYGSCLMGGVGKTIRYKVKRSVRLTLQQKTSLTQNRMNWDRWQSERDGQEELWKERKKGGIRRLASSSQVLLDGEVKGMDSLSDTQ
ncbi:hypothetical protein BY996DRAFT_6471911 [Phakopsora pachyrhizi]|uniref:Uncharacterized protein n=1 Tax=Phakopsora pachyrhizi TaxID=170000 RepID=A0AAV0BEN0_PHAPC|nr:hypothetical protein BY996DRAFT_6471911 [Phakopsora pachyrhizi]CAH7684664.1 hypothetical protein PPACK8108_LOCUS19039 [Phakopsora pachyrhizi]